MSEIINQKLQLQNVWKKQEAQALSVDFWDRILLKSGFDKGERAKEVTYHVLMDNIVIGVSTIKEIQVPNLANNYFFSFRMLIDPQYRIPGLADKLILETFNFLEDLYAKGQTQCIGIITLIENPNLLKVRKEVVYPTSKLALAGYTKQGKQIRLRYFKGATI